MIASLRQDESPEVRKAAARALGSLGDRAAVEPLIAALADGGAGVLNAAARSLGLLGDRRAVQPLTAVLEDLPEAARWEVRFSLEKLTGDGS